MLVDLAYVRETLMPKSLFRTPISKLAKGLHWTLIMANFKRHLKRELKLSKPRLVAFDGDPDIWFSRRVLSTRDIRGNLEENLNELLKNWELLKALKEANFDIRLMDYKRNPASLHIQQKGVDNAIAVAYHDAEKAASQDKSLKTIVLVSGDGDFSDEVKSAGMRRWMSDSRGQQGFDKSIGGMTTNLHVIAEETSQTLDFVILENSGYIQLHNLFAFFNTVKYNLLLCF